MRECFYGTSRFSDFAARTGLSDAVVATRLKHLSGMGVLERRPYVEPGQRGRFEYHLTERGRGFFPVLVALIQWGGAYVQEGDGVVQLTEIRTGQRVRITASGADGRALAPEDIAVQPRRRPDGSAQRP
ncbi:helix-turn-helix domain-containing protein [Conyzicola nivalis]|uniref:Transcriptional regulator n=2 Tax=Conyzicola nivalis TaxID=1477021 RepID=A0A916WEQ3_9MICO|nr:putative transcriptional regulator [Conyzicola nivalis]